MSRKVDSKFYFCLVGAATDTGRVRSVNEDSMAVFETADMKVFVVCDGMGGHTGGLTASQTAIAAIRDYLSNNQTSDPREAIHNAIIAANEAILKRTRQQPELAGMGSTCVMLTVTGDGKAYYGHVGDSRLYFIANQRITQLTKDHSFVQMLLDDGLITKEQAAHHPRKNEVTNVLGMKGMQQPAVSIAPIEPESGNCFLICSDGLTGMVEDEHIQRVISKHAIPIRQRAEQLVKMANDNGGADNITVELVEFAVGTKDIIRSGRKMTRKKMLLILLPLIALLAAGAVWYFFFKDNNQQTVQITPVSRNKIELPGDTIAYGKGLVEYSPKYLNKALQIDSVFILEANLIDCYINPNDVGCIVIKWLHEFTGTGITVICISGNDEYHIKIPVRHEQTITQEKINTERVIEKPPVKPDENLKVSNKVTMKKRVHVTIQLNKEEKLKGFQWQEGERRTSSDKMNMRADMTDTSGTLVIEWLNGDLPEYLIVNCLTTKNQLCRVKIVLEEAKEEQNDENIDI